MLGIGAAWNELEHDGYGYEFPPIGERMGRLDEALTIIRAMFTPGESAPEEVVRPTLEDSTEYPQSSLAAGAVIVTLAVMSLGLGIIAEPLIKLLQTSLS